MVLQGMLSYFDGGDAPDWVQQPRIHHQYLPDKLFVEPAALNAAQLAVLRQMGHTIIESESTWGNMQAIHWNRRQGSVTAASDPRVEGSASVR
jgi:gamma-glutamyltranspeptidase/glutathione hydrolase